MLDSAQSYELGMNYGRIFAVLRDAIKREGGTVGDMDIDRLFMNPQQEFVLLTKRAFAANALSDDDRDLLAALTCQIPLEWDKEEYDHDQVKCGIGSGFFTPYDMRPSQAAEALGVSKGRIYQLIADGTLKAIKAGKNKQFIMGASVHALADKGGCE